MAAGRTRETLSMNQRDEPEILLADDDAECRNALGELLRGAGYRTWLAASGLQAVELVCRAPRRPAISIFDFHMPDITGLEAFRMMRALRIVIPTILITGDPSREFLLEALTAGAETVVPKPINPAVFTYTVQQVIERHSLAGGLPPA